MINYYLQWCPAPFLSQCSAEFDNLFHMNAYWRPTWWVWPYTFCQIKSYLPIFRPFKHLGSVRIKNSILSLCPFKGPENFHIICKYQDILMLSISFSVVFTNNGKQQRAQNWSLWHTTDGMLPFWFTYIWSLHWRGVDGSPPPCRFCCFKLLRTEARSTTKFGITFWTSVADSVGKNSTSGHQMSSSRSN